MQTWCLHHNYVSSQLDIAIRVDVYKPESLKGTAGEKERQGGPKKSTPYHSYSQKLERLPACGR